MPRSATAPGREGSARYRLTRLLETHAARQRRCGGGDLRGAARRSDRARHRGRTRSSSRPTASIMDLFGNPPARRRGLRHAASASTMPDTVGFIGSFYDYEGLDDLIAAMPLLLERRPKAQLLLVGGGPMEAALKAQAAASPAADRIRFVGRVPHDEVERYYALIDILAYPRKAMRLTELVTPLKPLEAMAQRKLVAASNVGGHRELIEDGVTGTLFPAGDPRGAGRRARRSVRAARRMGGAARHGARASSSASVTGRQTFRVMPLSTNGLRARLHDRFRGHFRMRCAASGAMRSICRWRPSPPSRSPSSPSPCRAICSAELVGASGLPSILAGRRAAARLQGADRRRHRSAPSWSSASSSCCCACSTGPATMPTGQKARARGTPRPPPRRPSRCPRAPAHLRRPRFRRTGPAGRAAGAAVAGAAARAEAVAVPEPEPVPEPAPEPAPAIEASASLPELMARLEAGAAAPPDRDWAPRRPRPRRRCSRRRMTIGCRARSTACSASPRVSPDPARRSAPPREARPDLRYLRSYRPRCRRRDGRASRTRARRGRPGTRRAASPAPRPSRRRAQACAGRLKR